MLQLMIREVLVLVREEEKIRAKREFLTTKVWLQGGMVSPPYLVSLPFMQLVRPCVLYHMRHPVRLASDAFVRLVIILFTYLRRGIPFRANLIAFLSDDVINDGGDAV